MKTFYDDPVIYHNNLGVFTMTISGSGSPEYIDSLMQKHYPNESYLCVERDEAPKDSVYMDCWYYSDDPEPHIGINIERALEIQKRRLRFLRSKKFKDADVQFQIALEQNDQEKIDEVSAYKQSLRDVTNLVDVATTPILSMDPKDIVGVTSAIKLLNDEDLLENSDSIDGLIFKDTSGYAS